MRKLVVLGEEVPLRISPNFLKNAACPFNIRETYVRKTSDRLVKLPAIRGQAIHLTLADLTRAALDRQRDVSSFSDTEIRAAVQHATPHDCYSELGSIFQWAILWRNRFDLRMQHLVGFEEKMAIDASFRECNWDTADYRGIVDNIWVRGKHGIVGDYKSQPNILSQGELDRFEDATYYCWLVWKFYPQVETFEYQMWYLRYGFYMSTTRTARTLELYEHELMLKIGKISEIQDWDPVPGEHCGLCDFTHICPIGQDQSSIPPAIVTEQQALRVASELRVKEAWIATAKRKLRSYVSANDDVRLNGGEYVYGFRPQKTHTYDLEKLQALCREEGIPVNSLLRVEGKAFNKEVAKARKANSMLEDKLLETRTEKAKTQFKGYIPKEDHDADEEDSE